jgi:MerC mercury resistance protein
MVMVSLRSLRRVLLYVILPAVLLSANPVLGFGVSFERKASLDQAAVSPLFRNMMKERKAPTSRIIPFASAVPEEVPKEEATWKDRLLKISNIASILCVIDCTVLPIVTIVMPLLGLAAFTPAQMEWLHHFGKNKIHVEVDFLNYGAF